MVLNGDEYAIKPFSPGRSIIISSLMTDVPFNIWVIVVFPALEGPVKRYPEPPRATPEAWSISPPKAMLASERRNFNPMRRFSSFEAFSRA